MTREELIEAIARAMAECEPRSLYGDAVAAIAAIEAAGVRLVPSEAICDLEFARMADGTIKVGYNPRTEEGGWALVGDVTKSVTAIEAQRDQALRDLDAANQRLSNVFAALNASPFAPEQKP